MAHPIIIKPGLLYAYVTKSIPLGTSLGVEMQHVIVTVEVKAAGIVTLEVDNVVSKAFSASISDVKVIEPSVELDALSHFDFLCGFEDRLGCQPIEGWKFDQSLCVQVG